MPAENTFIQLVRQEVMNGRRQFQPAEGGGTDETGYFRMFGLSAGRYYISITARLSGVRRDKIAGIPSAVLSQCHGDRGGAADRPEGRRRAADQDTASRTGSRAGNPRRGGRGRHQRGPNVDSPTDQPIPLAG